MEPVVSGGAPAPRPAAPRPAASRSLLAPVARLERWLDVALVALLVACAVRYVLRHGLHAQGWLVIAGATLLGLVALVRPGVRQGPASVVRVVILVLVWGALTLMAPSFAWVAVAVAFAVLRALPFAYAGGVVALMALVVSVASLRISDGFDPTLVVGPIAMAALTVAAFRALERESAQRQALLDDLTAAQDSLLVAQHRSGELAERTRISREIHDSVGQGLSSINLFLQAAEQDWERQPEVARAHVGSAAEASRAGLDEVRRVVSDLAPSELDRDTVQGLHDALGAIVRDGAHGVTGEMHVHGAASPLPREVGAALLRTTRGALANVVEHADASRVAVTLTYERDEVRLDVRDDGRGFDPDQPRHARRRAHRGTGLDGIRDRAVLLGGRADVETAPGEGTTVSVALPRHHLANPAEETP